MDPRQNDRASHMCRVVFNGVHPADAVKMAWLTGPTGEPAILGLLLGAATSDHIAAQHSAKQRTRT